MVYSISKGAMQTMTRNLANAQGVNGVRVNQINPGWVLTEREDRDQVKKGLEPGWHQRLEREAIPSGEAQITGSFTQVEAQDLANVLKYGALPVSLDVDEVQQISPTLGTFRCPFLDNVPEKLNC